MTKRWFRGLIRLPVKFLTSMSKYPFPDFSEIRGTCGCRQSSWPVSCGDDLWGSMIGSGLVRFPGRDRRRVTISAVHPARTFSRVAPVHCCTGAPSGPRMHFPRTRPKQAARAVQVVCCSTVFPAGRGGCLAPVAGGVYEVCPVAARGAGRVVVDQVVRLDRLPGDLTGTSVPSPGGTGEAGRGSAGSPRIGCTARPAWTAGARCRSPAGV